MYDVIQKIHVGIVRGMWHFAPRFWSEVCGYAHLRFIDDAEHNVKAGERLGIRGVHMDSEVSAFCQLEKLGLIRFSQPAA